MLCSGRNDGFNCTFMCLYSPKKKVILGHWLTEVNILEMKNLTYIYIFIHNNFNSKPKISTKPQNADI